MKSKIRLLTAGAVLAIGAVVPAIAQAGGDSETPITGRGHRSRFCGRD